MEGETETMTLEEGFDMSKKYVYIEMIRQESDKYDVVSGLFRGIISKNGDMFVLLGGIDDTTNVLNTAYYGVLAIEVLVSTTKETLNEVDNKKYLTVFNHEEKDQKKAIEMVTSIYDSLVKSGMVLANDPEIIDISIYEDVPEAYKVGAPSKTSGSTVNGQRTSYSPPSTRYQPTNNNYQSFRKVDIKPEPEPKFFRRRKTEKKPTKEELIILVGKLDAIKDGNFETVLPDTPVPDGEPSPEDPYDYMYG